MREVWAVMGRLCLNPDYHAEMLPLALQGSVFEETGEFQSALWRQGLAPSRWEVMTLKLFLTESHDDLLTLPPRPIQAPDDDREIQAVQKLWRAAPPTFEEVQLCQAVGLAAVDTPFRERLMEASDPAEPPNLSSLSGVLSGPLGQGPIFALSQQQLGDLNEFLVQMKDLDVSQLQTLHDLKWVQPRASPCPVGSTIIEAAGCAYPHFSQARFVAAQRSLPPADFVNLESRLRELGIIIRRD